MVMIANLQYGWTLFVNPIDLKHHWGRAAVQVGFTIFVLTETWLVPVEGCLVDRFGPRIVVLVGGILVAIAWALNSVADALTTLYVAAAIGGIGAGAVPLVEESAAARYEALEIGIDRNRRLPAQRVDLSPITQDPGWRAGATAFASALP
jgi:MFS family permease